MQKFYSLSFYFFLLFTSFGIFQLTAQGIYQFWGTTMYGGPDDKGVLFTTKTDATGQNVKKFFTVTNSGNVYTGNKPVVYNNKLYLVTKYGGLADDGAIFEYNPVTNAYAKKADLFTIGGVNSASSLIVCNNKLYGVTVNGGAYNKGILFEYDPLTNTLTKKYDFNQAGGIFPGSDLVVFNNKLYGTTLTGGTNNNGTIYEFNLVNNTYTAKIHLQADITGATTEGGLIVYSNKLWGVTGNGVQSAEGGVLFSYDPITNTFSKKAVMNTINGLGMQGKLTLYNNKMYGITLKGANGYGAIFEYNPANNNLVNKFDFTKNTTNGYGEFTALNDKLYSCSFKGGTNDKGVLFSYDPNKNEYATKVDLSSALGYQGTGSLCLYNNKLFGCTIKGSAYDFGCVFQYDPAPNSYIQKIKLGGPEALHPGGKLFYHDNKIFGVTSGGGSNRDGVIYEYDIATGKYSTKINMQNESGQFTENGGFVMINNKCYGITKNGGIANKGVLFSYDPVSNIYSQKHNFQLATGTVPAGTLTELNGKLYGMCSLGGANQVGTIFEYNPSLNSFTNKFNFNSMDGKNPKGGFASYNGKLYAAVTAGGLNNAGTIVEYDPINNKFSKKADFSKAIGLEPNGTLVLYNKKLYGLTMDGGANNSGVLFVYDPATNSLVKKVDLNYPVGNTPMCTMTLYDGKLYGTTIYGGALREGGVLFEYDPATNTYTKKTDFVATNGRVPRSIELIQVPAPTAAGAGGACSNANTIIITSANKNKWVAFTNETGEAVAEINANGNILGEIKVNYYVHDGNTRADNDGRFYLNRNITITAQHQAASPVSIRLYIRKTEFEALKNTPGSGISKPGDIGVFNSVDKCAYKIDAVANKISSSSSIWGFDYVYETTIKSFSSLYFANKAYASLSSDILTFNNESQFLSTAGKKFTEVLFTPNPVKNPQAVLQIQSSSAQTILLSISDMVGRKVMVKEINVPVGRTQYVLDVSKLDKGIYQASYSAEGKIKTTRFVKE